MRRKSTLSGNYCREFSMQIVARIALGYKHVQQFQNNLVQMALGVIAGFGRSIFCHLSWMFPKLSFPKHQQNGQTNDGLDFIDFFLNAEATSDKIESKLFKRQMKIEEIVSQCLVILLAGFETTSNTLSLLFYYLAQNPKEQQKLVDEIQEVIEDNDSILSYEHLNKLKALSAFVNEVLRLHPVGAFAGKILEC
ncbi:putative cytochrome P450 CYP13A8 [Aphelenchoides bicaudatus]|nr:putative cytochrome P450 CYP13A8 [Aphelenchoides bicaudatus]